jgi:hypothetical protein
MKAVPNNGGRHPDSEIAYSCLKAVTDNGGAIQKERLLTAV